MAVPKGQSITGNYYATQVLTEVNNFYLKRRPKCGAKGIRLLHDNARPHKTKLVKEKINDVGMIELEHPPYSPDLSPCDFWLFDGLKKHLSGKEFESRMLLGRTIQRYLMDIPIEEYKKTFECG